MVTKEKLTEVTAGSLFSSVTSANSAGDLINEDESYGFSSKNGTITAEETTEKSEKNTTLPVRFLLINL